MTYLYYLKIQNLIPSYQTNLLCFATCCSSADEDCDDPGTKAVREKERRQANNVRERLVNTRNTHFVEFW